MTATLDPVSPVAFAPPRPAPAGFTDEQWRTFSRDGIVVIEDAIEPCDVARYLAAALACVHAGREEDPSRAASVISKHPHLAELIDHDRHVGFGFDLFGDQLHLVQADVLARGTGSVGTTWHVDGPRIVPFTSFAPVLPLKLRVGYWLTDAPDPDMGNLIYVPGSHVGSGDVEHVGFEDVPGQRVLRCAAGTITVTHASLWHRVAPNRHPRTRVNIFLSYSPSWVAGYYSYDQAWIDTLTREQRIILRQYADKKSLMRPPPEDIPLFQDDESPLRNIGELRKVRRLTRYERRLTGL